MVTSWNNRCLGPIALAAEPSEPASEHPPGELLEGWFRGYFARLWRLVARLGVARESIDDVVQDTFIIASRRHADIQQGREWSFLVGIAVRLGAHQRVRSASRREVFQNELLEQEASALPDAEQLLIEKRLREELEQALSVLSEQHRAVFVLYEIEGFSAPEIAELLGLPLGTVASRLGRARAKFSVTAARMQRAHLTRQEDS